MTRVQANNATIVSGANAIALQRVAPTLCTYRYWTLFTSLAAMPCPPAHRVRNRLAALIYTCVDLKIITEENDGLAVGDGLTDEDHHLADLLGAAPEILIAVYLSSSGPPCGPNIDA